LAYLNDSDDCDERKNNEYQAGQQDSPEL
jgi:hypothetical protein